MACSAPSADAPIISSLADYLECHAAALGQNGFAGAANGFFVTAMLTSCLTIYVALIGYRIILGQTYTVREAVLACVRVGLVITFCTRWPSYEVVFYRTVVEGPQDVASQMLQSSNRPILNAAEIAQRLQQDYEAIQTTASKRTLTPSLSASPPAPGVAAPQAVDATPLSKKVPAAPELSVAGLVFLISTVGSLLAMRLAAALLLAIGPLVILLALFDSLIGLLENWMAALAGTMLATVGIVIVTELELGFVESRLSVILDNGTPALTDQELLLTAALFSLCIVGVVIVAGLVGRRLTFSRLLPQSRGYAARATRSSEPFVVPAEGRRYGAAVAAPSRAAAVADAVRMEGRRERMLLGLPGSVSSNSSASPVASRGDPIAAGGVVSPGLGYSLRRSASAGRSISYARRGQRQ